ncbi:FecR domain-containing protein [Candidatus Sumerlaeota bacterium]|nr:FecR domain-containing protein [Candidatus Sumerlaeota bacterium]
MNEKHKYPGKEMQDFERFITRISKAEWESRRVPHLPEFYDTFWERWKQRFGRERHNNSTHRRKVLLPFAFLRCPIIRPVPVFASLLMALFIVVIWQLFSSSQITQMELLRLESAEGQSPGLSQWEEVSFRGNRRFELKENEFAMLKMRNGSLQIIVRSGSVGTVKNGRTLRFKEGELWAFAGKQAAGFTIQTPHSRVTITGTVFGIKTSPSMDEIVVLRGKLRAEVNKRVVLIEKGQSLRISYDENARETLSLSDHSAEPPEWAMELVRQYQKQYFYRYFPSAIENTL